MDSRLDGRTDMPHFKISGSLMIKILCDQHGHIGYGVGLLQIFGIFCRLTETAMSKPYMHVFLSQSTDYTGNFFHLRDYLSICKLFHSHIQGSSYKMRETADGMW